MAEPEPLTADVIDDAQHATATVTLDGDEYEITVERIGYRPLRDLERQEREGELSEEEVTEAVWEYLVEPDYPLDDVPAEWVDTIVRGIYRAWGASDETIDEALAEYDPSDVTGN